MRGESAVKGWEGIELITVVEWSVSGAKDLRFIDREFHKQGDKLRNDRLVNLSRVETGGMERHGWSEERVLLEGLIFMSLWRYFGSVIWRRLCVIKIVLYWIRYILLCNIRSGCFYFVKSMALNNSDCRYHKQEWHCSTNNYPSTDVC